MVHGPTLETDRLTLRSFVDSDIEDLIRAIMGDPAVMETFPGDSSTTSEQRALALEWMGLWNENWQAQGYGTWAICTRAAELAPQGSVIGFCGFEGSKGEDDGPEFSYGLGSAYWGKGLATEASRACLDSIFTATEIPRIHAVVTGARNPKSNHILEKLGFTYECDAEVYDSVARGWGLLPIYVLDRDTYLERKEG